MINIMEYYKAKKVTEIPHMHPHMNLKYLMFIKMQIREYTRYIYFIIVKYKQNKITC